MRHQSLRKLKCINLQKLHSNEFFDKTDYRVEELRKLIGNSNWCLFYNQTCAEGMFTVFTNIIKKHCGDVHPIKQFLLEMIKTS